jgi:TetR/AcrR family transcriptional repressor of nem operon
MHGRGAETRERILDAAQAMIQQQGYNAVSFRDLAAIVKIKPASIHYYFPSKQDLVTALVQRYRQFFEQGRVRLDAADATALQKIEKYIGLLRSAFRQTGRMCLCGVLAAEASTLPRAVVESVKEFFKENEAWLANVLAAGKKQGELSLAVSPERAAEALFANLEGALMAAWTFKDESRLASTGQYILESLKSNH